jgi:2'-5' RNA ligase
MAGTGEHQGRGMSLWLVPEGTAREGLAALIAELASRFGSEVFEPHVTLLAGIERSSTEVIACAATLAGWLEAPMLPLRPAECREDYFRRLFLPVAETLKLLTAHAQARALFEVADERPFEPHLSLVYGQVSSSELERVAREVASRVPSRLAVTRLDVMRTSGPVSTWCRLRSLPLGEG